MKAVVLAFGLALAGCTQKPAPAPVKEFSLHGEIISVDPSGQVVTVKGDKIEGWMDAMSMEYPVKDKHAFASLKTGEKIDAKIEVQGTEYWLSDVREATGK